MERSIADIDLGENLDENEKSPIEIMLNSKKQNIINESDEKEPTWEQLISNSKKHRNALTPQLRDQTLTIEATVQDEIIPDGKLSRIEAKLQEEFNQKLENETKKMRLEFEQREEQLKRQL